MLSDLRLAFRQLAKSPGFVCTAIATLALAIGVNSAVFSLVDALLLRPAVALRPDELVNLFNGRQGTGRDFRRFSHAEYLALREAKEAFADVGATIVGSMATVLHGTVNPPRSSTLRQWTYDDGPAIELRKGEEMGRFLLGSTVVLLFPAGGLQFNPAWMPGGAIRMGEMMARRWVTRAVTREDAPGRT